MTLTSNTRRQADLAAGLVNLVVPGQSGGRDHAGAAGAALTREFVAALSAAMGRKIAAADPGGRRLPTLARALHAAFAAPDTAAAAGVLNELMRRYRSRPYLTEGVGQPFHLHFHGEAANAVDSLGGEFATALALVIDAYGHKRFGLCQAHACDRAYVDLTRNGSRRYCSEACTARAKMAAYRERKSGA